MAGASAATWAAGALASLLSSLPGVDQNRIGNLVAAAGGADEETLEEGKRRAPRALKAQGAR